MCRVFKIYILLFSILLSPAFAEDQKKAGQGPTEHDGPKEHYTIHLDEIIVSEPMQQKISSYAKPVTVLHLSLIHI